MVDKLKILLLGSSGVVGTAIKIVCDEEGIECISQDHTNIDIEDTENLHDIINIHNPTHIINAVGIVGPKICEDDSAKAFAINAIAVCDLAHITKSTNIPLIHISTHAIFDGYKADPYTEMDIPNPLNVYGVSKYAAELFVKNNCEKFYIIRFPMLYGPRSNNRCGIIDKILWWLEKGDSISVSIDKLDSPSYSVDVAKEMISVLKEEKPYGTYHISNSGTISFFDFVNEIKDFLNSTSKIVGVLDKEFEPKLKPLKTSLSSIKLESLRNWREALYDYLCGLRTENKKSSN